MRIRVDVSAGEFLDKLTILEIKSERMRDEDKLVNVRKELTLLRKVWDESPSTHVDVSSQVRELKAINEKLWDVEDRIRLKEADGTFDDDFVRLARSVYQLNDRRADVKREINRLLGSELTEEKSYADYRPPAG